jgi:CRP/FNR family transcriptional regulator, dissimilatory nitrate respiration regulator
MSDPAWRSAAVEAQVIERKLRAGQTLFRAGTKTVGLYEIAAGKVKLVRVDRRGREAVLQAAGAGDTLAEASLFSPTYHCDAIAMTTAVVRLYPKAILLGELRRDPELLQAFAAMLAQQVMTLRSRLERRNIHSARDRIRHFLAIKVDADGRTVRLPGTLKELAADLGLTHEALYRTLARMEAEGEIKRMDGVIRIGRAV